MNKDCKIEMYCPMCNRVHVIEKRKRITKALVKGEEVEFTEVYFSCYECDEEENEFVPAGIMDHNLLRARDAYRVKKCLLTSKEISNIRTIYGLTQSEYAAMLGWGEVTVTRYESKTIQDETYDRMMRLSMENPMFALNSLDTHKDRFSTMRYHSIRNAIEKRVEEIGILYLRKQQIYSQYVLYMEPSGYNGNKPLDINTIANLICYFAQSVQNLYKVKLMKLLWYADAMFYSQYGVSMTGLVYRHMPLGALPIAHDEIITLPTVNIIEEFIHSDIAYHIVPKQELSLSVFTSNELEVLEFIVCKFKHFNTTQMVEYMHEEKAYMNTKHGEIISYKEIEQLNVLK